MNQKKRTHDGTKLIPTAQKKEMVANELVEMLEAELNKKDAEMDTQLVEEIMLTLEPDGPDAATLERTWERIASGLPGAQRKRKALRVLGWLGKAAVCILVVLMLLRAVYGVTKAAGEEPPPGLAQECASNGVLHTTAEDEFPDTYKGYRVIPAWIPDRFAFEQATRYENGNMAKSTIIYDSPCGACTIIMIACPENAIMPQCAYEKKPNNDDAWCISGCSVDRYTNADDEVLSASWIVADAHYSIYGAVSEEEMQRIIAGIIN